MQTFHTIRKLLLPLLFLAALIMVIVCSVNPVTGKREFMLYTVQDEIALGQDTDKQIIEQYGLYEDAELEAYINQMGKAMVPNCHRPDLDFKFRILDTDVINAFAVPGGYIYFTRGILAYLNNEAELAGVMGHELGHVTARHSMKQMTNAAMVQLGMGLGSVLSEKFAQYAGVAGMGVQMLFLKYSRDNEHQADALGVEYSSKTGFDSHNMANFFTTLNRMHPSEDGAIPSWFSTHPNPKNRVQNVLALSDKWQTKLTETTFAVNAKPYLNEIHQLNYGPDPRHGFVEGNAFYHPGMKFQFAVPKNWQVQNLPAQVQLLDPSENAAMILTVSKASTPQGAADEFIQSVNAEVSGIRSTQINGLTARRIRSMIPQDQDTVATVSYFIKQPERVIAIHGIAAPGKINGYVDTFDRTINGFKPLKSSKYLSRKCKKLIVKPASKSGPLKSALIAAGVKQEQLEELSLINGKLLTDSVKKGDLIKVLL